MRDALTAQAISVWWDRQLAGGEEWRAAIQGALDGSACVVVVWSEHSVGASGRFVRDEASRAAERGVLLPVSFDGSRPPLGFGELQCLDLRGWQGKASDPRFQDVLAAVRAKKDGQAAPIPRWPSLKRKKRWAVALITGLPAAAAVFLVVRQPLCELCNVSVGRDICLRVLGQSPQAPREETKVLPQHVSPSRAISTALADAKQAAQAEGDRDARETVCAGFEQSQAFQLIQATSRVERWNCAPVDGGFTCGFEGKALCTLRISGQPGSCQ